MKKHDEDLLENVFKQVFRNCDETESRKALKKIKTIINDDSLNDRECDRKVAEIMDYLERFGVCRSDPRDLS